MGAAGEVFGGGPFAQADGFESCAGGCECRLAAANEVLGGGLFARAEDWVVFRGGYVASLLILPCQK